MRITACAISLNVEDVVTSSAFLTEHFSFHEEMVADGFASLARADAGMNIVFLRQGLITLPEDQRYERAAGLIVVFAVDDLESEMTRLRAKGVVITMPLTEEEWGERSFQVTDPNGVRIQLTDWKGAGAKTAT